MRGSRISSFILRPVIAPLIRAETFSALTQHFVSSDNATQKTLCKKCRISMPHSHVLSDPSSLSHSPALCASFIRHYGHRQVMPNLHIIFLVDRSSSLLCSLFVYSYLRISKAHRAHILGRSSIEFSVNSKYGAASCCAC